MREIQNEGEYNFSVKIGAHIVPQYSVYHKIDKRLGIVHGTLWSETVPLASRWCLHDLLLPPLPKPKPDMTFAFSKDAFTKDQLAIMMCV